MKVCPSCGYERQQKDDEVGIVPANECPKGLIRYKHYGNSMSDIAENREIIAELDRLNRE